MKGSVKAAIITGLLGVVGTVSAALIGLYVGKSAEQRNIQNEINEAFGDVINVIGDGNDVTVNDIRELVEEYQELKKQNTSLVDQNTKYFDDLEEVKEELELLKGESGSEVERLTQQLSEMPVVEFKNMGLCLDGNNVAMSTTNSVAVVNNQTYYSDEFIKNLVDSGKGISTQGDILYIGKIVKDKEALSEKWLMNKSSVFFSSTEKDSYGNNHVNTMLLGNGSSVIYNLNQEYSHFQCNVSVRDSSSMSRTGNIIIKADGTEVYKSPELTKLTEAFDIDIPINNCSLLTIECAASSSSKDYMLSDCTVYN